MCFSLDLAIIVQTLLRIVNLQAVVCELPELKTTSQHLSVSLWVRVSSLIVRWRRLIIVALDVAMIISANYLAFVLRFDGNIPAEEIGKFQQTVFWLVGIRGVAFAVFGLHEGRRRYTSIWDLQNIVGGVFTSTIMFYVLVYWALDIHDYPRSVFVIDS